MTTQATPDITERVSRLEGAYEQVTERLRDLTEALQSLRAEMRSEITSVRGEIGSLKTTIIVIGGAVWASTVGGFIALLVAD